MKKQLIINADDLGSDINRNNGIFETVEAGIVRNVSILANGPALEDVVNRIKSSKDCNISIGIHINLSEGRPLTEGLRLLTDKDGNFLSKKMALALLSGQADMGIKDEIEAEIDAQIKKILGYGLNITHMDGHHHIHIIPPVIEAAIKKAREFNINWMRVPDEPVDIYNNMETDVATLYEAQFFSGHALAARPYIKKAGINTTDHFIGLYLKGRLSPHILIKLTKDLKEGVTEMMVHPGREALLDKANPFTAFSTKKRDIETDALLSPDFKIALKENSVNIKSFLEVKR